MDRFAACRALSNEDLLSETARLARDDKAGDVALLLHIGEVDRRALAEACGYRSLYQYCVEHLKIGEAVAYWRIQAARAAREFPMLLEHIEAGRLNVTTVKLIGPHLIGDGALGVIERALGKTRKEVEAMVAAINPVAPRPDLIVKCGPVVMARAQWPPAPTTAEQPQQQALDVVEALDAERRRLHFDVGPDTAALIERAREILRHKYPLATLEDIVREALNLLLDEKDFDRAQGPGGPKRPSDPAGRAIPMWVKREVWKRDGGCCSFVGDGGKVCGARTLVEFDHVIPFALGGRSDDPANVRLLCRAHNRLAADRAFSGGAGGGGG